MTCPTENAEQTALFQWAEMQGAAIPELRLLYAIPNGGYRPPRTAAILKRTGVKPGVPDLCLPVGSGKYHALYIEMKRMKGGTVSAYQKIWHNQLTKYGNKVAVCHGWVEAAEAIKNYLGVGE